MGVVASESVWPGTLVDWVAVLSGFGLVAVAISTVVALRAFQGERRSREVQTFLHLHGFIAQEHFHKARQLIRQHQAEPLAQWSDEHRDAAHSVCSSYDQAGLLVDLIEDRAIVDQWLKGSWGQSILKQYEWLSPYLEELDDGKPRAAFYLHFGHLATRAKEVRKVAGPP